MKKFTVKLQRTFEVEIEAADLAEVQALVPGFIGQFPANSCKVLSILQEGVAIEVLNELKEKTNSKPKGKPDPFGGSPGTPVARAEVLVDQIAAAA